MKRGPQALGSWGSGQPLPSLPVISPPRLGWGCPPEGHHQVVEDTLLLTYRPPGDGGVAEQAHPQGTDFRVGQWFLLRPPSSAHASIQATGCGSTLGALQRGHGALPLESRGPRGLTGCLPGALRLGVAPGTAFSPHSPPSCHPRVPPEVGSIPLTWSGTVGSCGFVRINISKSPWLRVLIRPHLLRHVEPRPSLPQGAAGRTSRRARASRRVCPRQFVGGISAKGAGPQGRRGSFPGLTRRAGCWAPRGPPHPSPAWHRRPHRV